jgi:hypothetical protein
MPVIYNGNIIGSQSWSTGTFPGTGASNSASWMVLDINRDNATGPFSAVGSDICVYNKQLADSHLLISWWIPTYITPGGAGNGIRLRISTDASTYTVDALDEGPAHGWGAHGYGGNASGVWTFTWDTKVIDTVRSTSFGSHSGNTYFYFEWRNWLTSDTSYPLTYDPTLYPKYGTIELLEYIE